MMLSKLVGSFLCVILFIILLNVNGRDALQCLPCSHTKCRHPQECKGGLVKDICNCCYRCAKIKKQTCGGPWGMFGKCDKGLICLRNVKPGRSYHNAKGVCTCGPVCLIFCPRGNVLDRNGCPTCRCKDFEDEDYISMSEE